MRISKVFLLAVTGLCFFAGTAFADTTVHVKLIDAGNVDFSKKHDMGMGGKADHKMAPLNIEVDMASVPAGKVTFDVTNNGKETVHEMVVSALTVPDAKVPFDEEKNEINEETLGMVGEVEDLDPGKSKSFSGDLKPGTYLLYCNVPGHFDAGMWTKIEVK